MAKELVKFNDTKALGKNLVTAASESIREEMKNRCVALTKEVMDRITHYENKITTAKQDLRFFQDKLEAIQRGEFVIDEINRTIIMNEGKFNYRRE